MSAWLCFSWPFRLSTSICVPSCYTCTAWTLSRGQRAGKVATSARQKGIKRKGAKYNCKTASERGQKAGTGVDSGYNFQISKRWGERGETDFQKPCETGSANGQNSSTHRQSRGATSIRFPSVKNFLVSFWSTVTEPVSLSHSSSVKGGVLTHFSRCTPHGVSKSGQKVKHQTSKTTSLWSQNPQ